MKTRILVLVVVGAAWAVQDRGGPGRSVAHGEEPPPTLRVASLIRRLGSESFRERDQAHADLLQLGAATREQLEAAASDADPEIRLRAKDLLRQLKVRQLWTAREVPLEKTAGVASQVAVSLGHQTGNRVLLGEPFGVFKEGQVTLPTQGEFWPLLDSICQQTGNRVKLHYDTRSPGLILVAGTPGKNPVAYAGPVRAQITSARRSFAEELRYDNLDLEQTHTFQLDFQMMWEERFRLVAYRSQPELVQAVTDCGDTLVATQPSGGGWNVAGGATRQICMNLRLQPPATRCRELDTLALKWGLIAVGDLAQITVDNLESRDSFFQDDVELRIDQVHMGPGPRCEIVLVITRDLVIPEPQDVMFQENEVELFDGEGRAFRKQGQTNTLSERGAQMKLSFVGESTTSAPAALRVTYPRIRAQHDLEIVFRHVPLPVSRPE